MKVYLIDNFDSFTYNLVHLLKDCGINDVVVERNDVINAAAALACDAVLISPGPGIPSESGKLMEVLGEIKGKVPILGVCLGMQAIGELFGASLRNLDRVYHGLATEIEVKDHAGVFAGLPDRIEVGRYHSWVVHELGNAPELRVTACDDKAEIMAMRHVEMPIYGVQFHPESVLTPEGQQMLANFLKISAQ